MSPTEKQINLVDKITSLLKIDFPMSSKDFTKSQYSYFISAYINDYINTLDEYCFDDDDEMLWFPMLNG